MHIAFLSSMHTPFDKRVFDKEARSLKGAGFSITHICPADPTRFESSFEKEGINFRTYAPPGGIRGRLRQLKMLYDLSREVNADVNHCNEVDSWFVGVCLRIFHGKTCVFDVHEHYPSVFAESRFPKFLQPFVRGLIRLIFLILTPFTRKLVLAKETVAADFLCPKSKKLVVKNYSPRRPVGDRIVQEKSLEGPLKVIHLGLIGRARGWEQILDAIHQVKDRNIDLTFIGEFNDNSQSEFERRIQKLELEDKVTFLDWMPFEEAFARLHRAHVGLIMFQPGIQNHTFAMPHKLFDYMNAGMVSVLPDFAVEVAPVIREEECGFLVDPSDASDLASVFSKLDDNRDLIREMGKRGRKAVENRYNWQNEAEKLIAFYQGFLVKSHK